jgi:hypothetical protein
MNSQINNINTILTGVTYDSYYDYQNFSNNVHIYGILKTATNSDVDGALNTINTTIQQISYSTSYGGFTQINNLYAPVFNCANYQYYGTTLPNLGNLIYLDSATSLSGSLNNLQSQINSFSTISSSFIYLQNQINSTNNTDTYQSLYIVTLSSNILSNYNYFQNQINSTNNVNTYQSLHQSSLSGNILSLLNSKQNTITAYTNLSISSLICTSINSSSGQTMNFNINNTMYMQIYSNGVVNIGNNQVFNKQLVLYDDSVSDTPSSATFFYGFGINSHVLRYQVDSTSSSHKFYGSTTNYATIDNSGITINNGNLNLSSSQPSLTTQLGYNNYTSTNGTTTYTCTTTLQAWTSVASITLPNAGTYMVFCFNTIKPSSTLTNASFTMEITFYSLSTCYQFYSSLPSGTYVSINTNPITISVTSSTTLSLYFVSQCTSGSANLSNNFNMQYTRIG